MSSNLEPLTQRLQAPQARILIITGAGISAESGISTFRGAGGYWNRFRAEDLASPDGFSRDPELVWQWYMERREALRQAKPNAGHHALRELCEHVDHVTLVTQNVDGLHGVADRSKFQDYIEIHGNIWRVKCCRTGKTWAHPEPFQAKVPHCQCGAKLRPDVLWFGETYKQDDMHRALKAARRADCILIVGTSGMVWIVSGLLTEAKPEAYTVEFNLETTDLSTRVHQSIVGPSGKTLPALLDILRKNP